MSATVISREIVIVSMMAQAKPEMTAQGAGYSGEDDRDLWLYRDRTVALLKRYARMAVETGRLPSLIGRECFRARVTSYSMASFEDMAIFVHDVEMALRRLDDFQQQLIALNVLEEYKLPEVARLLRWPLRTVERETSDALDELSRIFLAGGLMNEIGSDNGARKTCQEGRNCNFAVSDCKDGKNIF